MSEVNAGKEAVRKSLAKVTSYMMAEDIHPLDLLKETIENQDWFKGLILSATFFEMFGLMTLMSYYRRRKREHEYQGIIAGFFRRIGLKKIVRLLCLCDLIKPKTYSKMMEIIEARNYVVHRYKTDGKDFAFLVEIEQDFKERAIRLVADAIDCLKELGVRY